MSALLLLGAVTAAGLLAVADALGVQGAADSLAAHGGKVRHPPAADQHDGVLLEVVAHAGDVGRDLDVAGEPHPRHLAERRVRLLGRGGVDARADPAALRAGLERRGLVLGYLVLPALTDQLLDRGQRVSIFSARVARSVLARLPARPSFDTHTLACGFSRLPGPRGRACHRSRGAPGPYPGPDDEKGKVLRTSGPRDRRPSSHRDHSPQTCRARESRARRARLPNARRERQSEG